MMKSVRTPRKTSDRQNARIEHDKALKRVINALFKDDAQLFKQFQDNDSFRGWLTDTVFGMTYERNETSTPENTIKNKTTP